MKDNFEGKLAVVTGAARGIGRAIATALDQRGAAVIVSDIDAAGAARAAATLSRGESATCDVRDEAQVTGLLRGAADRHGHLDVVIANAGIGHVKPLLEMSFDEWRETLSVNLDGVFLTTRTAAQIMVGQGSGSIVTIASITAFAGSPGIGNYSAAKAGVVNLTRTLNSECRGFGVRVNAVCPGFIKTTLVDEAQAGFDALLPGELTLEQVITAKQSRWGEPEDVAAAVCVLAGDRAPWISGTAYTLDGGFRASLL